MHSEIPEKHREVFPKSRLRWVSNGFGILGIGFCVVLVFAIGQSKAEKDRHQQLRDSETLQYSGR